MSQLFEHDVEIAHIEIELQNNQVTEVEPEQTNEIQINPAIEKNIAVTNSKPNDCCQGSSVTHYELSDFGNDENNIYTEYPAAYDQYETTDYINTFEAIKDTKSEGKPNKKDTPKLPPNELSKNTSSIMVAIFGFILFLIVAIFIVLVFLFQNIDIEAEKAESEGNQLEIEFANLSTVLKASGILEIPYKVKTFSAP